MNIKILLSCLIFALNCVNMADAARHIIEEEKDDDSTQATAHILSSLAQLAQTNTLPVLPPAAPAPVVPAPQSISNLTETLVLTGTKRAREESEDDKTRKEVMRYRIDSTQENNSILNALLLVGRREEYELTIVEAARRGNILAVKRFIESGIDVNSVDEFGNRALLQATSYGHKDIVKLLIDARANLNMVDIHGNTALLLAVGNNHKDIAKLLIDAGAYLDVVNYNGYTALALALTHGRDDGDIVKLLIDGGINIDFAYSNGATALIMAARKGYINIVKLLIDAGANIDAIQWGLSALQLANNLGHIDVADMLEAEPKRRQEAQERRKAINMNLRNTGLPSVLVNMIDSYLPIDLRSILADAQEAEMVKGNKLKQKS